MRTIERDILTVNNFTNGRHNQSVKAIVIHVMEGTWEGTNAWFNNEASDVSAHYGVSKTGLIKQWVEENDQAWHAGIVKNPTSALVKSLLPINPNAYTIGIEFEGSATSLLTKDQLEAGAELIENISKRNQIELINLKIIPHRAIRADKSCPGNISMTELLARAQQLRTEEPSTVLTKLAVLEAKLESHRVEIASIIKEIKEES